MGRGPQGLWAPSEAGAAGSAAHTVAPRPCAPGSHDAQPSREGETTHAAADVGTRLSPRPGARRVEGSAWPPQHHHPELLSSVGRPQAEPLGACRTPSALRPQACFGDWVQQAPGTGGGGPQGPRALFQRPENGNCAKRIPKSGRAPSPPAYIKPQEPARGLSASG